MQVIAETMYGEPATQPKPGDWNRFLRPLQQAQQEQRRAKIVYSRAWRPGVTERVIEPLRLVQTHRGWEIDAGPTGTEGNLRTYILSNVRSAALLDETFEPPAGLESLLERQRRVTTVRMELAPRTPAGPPICTPSASPSWKRTKGDPPPTFSFCHLSATESG